MEVKNCRNCGRIFNYIGGGMLICPVCAEEAEKKFAQVKEYIRENPGATIPIISRDNDVSVNQIEKWVREERLVFADDSPIGIECENCGVTIKYGRYCPKCKDAISKGLGNLYRKEPQADTRKEARDRARMRFLDN